MHTYFANLFDVCMCVHCLQVIGLASTQSSSALHQNTRAYDVPNVTADKDQRVNICVMVLVIITLFYVHTYVYTV